MLKKELEKLAGEQKEKLSELENIIKNKNLRIRKLSAIILEYQDNPIIKFMLKTKLLYNEKI